MRPPPYLPASNESPPPKTLCPDPPEPLGADETVCLGTSRPPHGETRRPPSGPSYAAHGPVRAGGSHKAGDPQRPPGQREQRTRRRAGGWRSGDWRLEGRPGRDGIGCGLGTSPTPRGRNLSSQQLPRPRTPPWCRPAGQAAICTREALGLHPCGAWRTTHRTTRPPYGCLRGASGLASPRRHSLPWKLDGHSSDRLHAWKETGSRGAVPRVVAGLGEGITLKSEGQGTTRK